MAKVNMQKRKGTTPVAASKNGSEPTDKPRIAWHRLSVKKSLEIGEMDEISAEVQRLAIAIDSGLASQEHMERWLDLSSLTSRKQTIEKRAEIFAQYVEYVPRDWFVDNMPDEIDFGEPDTYLELQPAKFGELYGLLSYGPMAGEAASGN